MLEWRLARLEYHPTSLRLRQDEQLVSLAQSGYVDYAERRLRVRSTSYVDVEHMRTSDTDTPHSFRGVPHFTS